MSNTGCDPIGYVSRQSGTLLSSDARSRANVGQPDRRASGRWNGLHGRFVYPGMSWTGPRLALRRLLHAPLFTAVTLLTLAIGIGANTAIFSVVYGVLLKPLPFAEPERLVSLWHRGTGHGHHEAESDARPTTSHIATKGRVFQDIGIWNDNAVSITGTRRNPSACRRCSHRRHSCRCWASSPVRGPGVHRADDVARHAAARAADPRLLAARSAAPTSSGSR